MECRTSMFVQLHKVMQLLYQLQLSVPVSLVPQWHLKSIQGSKVKQYNHHSIALLWMNTTYLHYLIIYLLWASVSFHTASKLTKGYNNGSSYVYCCTENLWISASAATQLNNVKVVLFIFIKKCIWNTAIIRHKEFLENSHIRQYNKCQFWMHHSLQ